MFLCKNPLSSRAAHWLFASGQLSMALSILLHRFVSPILPLEGPGEFLQGFFSGLSIVANLAFLVWYRKSARSKSGGFPQ